jgi:two-component system cell cycle sensor histidine kinase/response regulator CckA
MAESGKHILIVDDEALITSLYQEFLNDYGFDSIVCEDGASALRTFEQTNRPFDLVITDQTMPYMTGTELSIALLARVPTLPIILLTGASEVIHAESTNKIGIQHILQKPVSLLSLKEIIDTCLDSSI